MINKPQKLGKVYKVLISRLVEPPQAGDKTKFWPREMKLAKDAWNLYPVEDFWAKVDLGYKVKSLAALKLKNVLDLLHRKIAEYKYVPPQEPQRIEVQVENLGPNYQNTSTKPKFLKDYLK